MAWGDTLHFQILWSISCQLQNLKSQSQGFDINTRHRKHQQLQLDESSHKVLGNRGSDYLSSEVFKDGRAVHRCSGSHSAVAGGSGLQVSVDTTHWELQRSGWTHEGRVTKASLVGQELDGNQLSNLCDDWMQYYRSMTEAMNEQTVSGQTCNPALCEREIAFVFVFPESFPAFPPAWKTNIRVCLALPALTPTCCSNLYILPPLSSNLHSFYC